MRAVKQVHSEIEIAAPVDRVWRALIDFAAYPSWNPLLTKIRGEPRVGERLRVRLAVGKRAMTIAPTILRVDEARALVWRGSLPIPGLFVGEHWFELHALDGGRTRFHQWEKFTGLLIPLMTKLLDGDTKRGYERMNEALKAHCEASA